MKGLKSQLPAYALLGALLAVAAGLVTRNMNISDPSPVKPVGTGGELVLVFIASSTCAGIDDPRLESAFDRIRDQLQQRAAADDRTFLTVGVFLDRRIEQGLELVRRFGPFDEVMIGRSWLNTGALKYIWEEFPGAASIPQLVLVKREAKMDRLVEINNEHVILRKIGPESIVTWI